MLLVAKHLGNGVPTPPRIPAPLPGPWQGVSPAHGIGSQDWVMGREGGLLGSPARPPLRLAPLASRTPSPHAGHGSVRDPDCIRPRVSQVGALLCSWWCRSGSEDLVRDPVDPLLSLSEPDRTPRTHPGLL